MTTKETNESKGAYGVVYRELWLLQIMRDPLVAPRHFKVAYAMSINMNIYSGEMFPSRDTIMGRTAVCERTIDRALNELQRRGHLKRRPAKFSAAKRKREMKCWPVLRWTDLSKVTDNLVRSLWTKMAEEPLNREPLREPIILTASVGTDAATKVSTREGSEGDFRDSKGNPNTPDSPPSFKDAVELARGVYGSRGASLAARQMVKHGISAAAVHDVVAVAIENGCDVDELAHRLWELSKE